MASTQRRSKPVKGSVLSFVLVLLGAVLVVAGAASLGSVEVSFAAEVPLLDFGAVPALDGGVVLVGVVFAGVVDGVVVVWPYPPVGSAANVAPGNIAASTSAIGSAKSSARAGSLPFLVGAQPGCCGSMKATGSLLLMPTSRSVCSDAGPTVRAGPLALNLRPS
jgi:hypothetical protein